MAKILQQILIKLIQSLIELIFFLPLILVASISVFPSNRLIAVFYTLPVSYLVGIIFCFAFKTRHKAIYYTLGLLVTVVFPIFVFGFEFTFPFLLFWSMNTISVYRGIYLAHTSWIKESPLTLFGINIAAYFMAYFVFFFIGIFKPYLNLLIIGGITSVFLFLIICSFGQLRLAILSDGNKNYIPSSLLKSNLTFLFLTFIFIVVLSQIKQFWSFVWLLLKSVLGFFFKILDLISSKISVKSYDAPPSKLNLPGGDEGHMNKWLSLILNIIYDLLGAVIIIGFSLILIYLIAKLILSFIRLLSGVLNFNENKSMSLGYIDEKESLLKQRKFTGILKKKLISIGKKEPSWKTIKNNRDRIRFIYKQTIMRFIKGGYSFKSHFTPSETGNEIDKLYNNKDHPVSELTVLYNKARYGIEDIPDEDVPHHYS